MYPLGSIPPPLRQLAARAQRPNDEKSNEGVVVAPEAKRDEIPPTPLLVKVRNRLRLGRHRA